MSRSAGSIDVDQQVNTPVDVDQQVHTPDPDTSDDEGKGGEGNFKWEKFAGLRYNGRRIREEINHSYH